MRLFARSLGITLVLAWTAITACSSFDTAEAPPAEDDAGPAGPSGDAAPPGDAAAPDPIVQLAAGTKSACAVRASGRVLCWGSNDHGAAGQPPIEDDACDVGRCRSAPTAVPRLADVTHVSVGDSFACARRRDGTVLCWGNNAKGTLGTGEVNPAKRDVPERVPGLTDALDVVAGFDTACARVKKSGKIQVYCWGSRGHGLLANAASMNGVVPAVHIPALDGAQSVSLAQGSPFACAVLEGAAARCWGVNQKSVLGHAPGSEGDVICGEDWCNATPSGPAGASPLKVKEVVAGQYSACALTTKNTVACWGLNSWGALGTGKWDDDEHPTPVEDASLGAVDALVGGGPHVCVLKKGEVLCRGFNGWGELGNGQESEVCSGFFKCKSAIVTAKGVSGVTVLGAGPGITLAYGPERAFAWGTNAHGQLGHPPGASGDTKTGVFDSRCNPTPQPLAFP